MALFAPQLAPPLVGVPLLAPRAPPCVSTLALDRLLEDLQAEPGIHRGLVVEDVHAEAGLDRERERGAGPAQPDAEGTCGAL